jgi:hypothetical protein
MCMQLCIKKLREEERGYSLHHTLAGNSIYKRLLRSECVHMVRLYSLSSPFSLDEILNYLDLFLSLTITDTTRYTLSSLAS